MTKIYAQKHGKMSEEDRVQLAALLLKLGYTVRIGRERQGDRKPWVYFIEYQD